MSVEQLIYRKFKNKIRKARGKNGLEYRGCCPFCRPPDKRYKLYMNPARFGGVYNCYACGQSGFLRDLLGVKQDETAIEAPVQAEEPLPENVQSPGLTVAIDALPIEHPAIEYMTKTRMRPFDPIELARDYGVRYCVERRRYGSAKSGFVYDTTNTLIFPIWMFGKLVGWQSRLLYDPEKMDDGQCAALNFPKDEDNEWIRPPKYYTGPGVSKGRLLYNFDNARKFKYVAVTEGTFDAIAVGLPAVATFGKGVSEHQARLLKTYWDVVILLLDPGDADAESDRLFLELERAISVIQVDLVGYKDAGDMSRDEIWRQVSDTIRKDKLALEALLKRGAELTPVACRQIQVSA